LRDRINLKAILEYSEETGASVGGTPKFEGEISEAELLSALQLLITTMTGIDIPATHNGLGYNNLIHMALLLAKMQMDCSSYVGLDNAKVFPMLLIEEPEAHLHPSLQFKFLKFLRNNIASAKQVRQLFITTHSTHIAAAVKLEELICMYVDDGGLLRIAYPGKVFDLTNTGDLASKNYIERFLDATKSDMLFANRVLFVEGISEQLLVPCFTLYERKSLEDKHVAVINIGGRYFHHFLKLFDYHETDPFKRNAIKKRIACLADADPVKRESGRWRGCYPFELLPGSDDYKIISSEVTNLKSRASNNISIFCNDSGSGKTLEFDLAFANPECTLLLTPCVPSEHSQLLTTLMSTYSQATFEDYKHLTHTDPNLLRLVDESAWNENDKKRGLIAAYYQRDRGDVHEITT
jgi:predicted ATP-dependent endonuclease of OLD family